MTSRALGPRMHQMLLAVAALVLLAGCSGSPTSSAGASPTSAASASTQPAEEPSAPPVVGDGEEWIVFQGVELGLTFIRPDGTGNHVILGPPGDQVHPDWSPDGSQIAYVQATDTAAEVMITDPLGTDPQPLVADIPAELADLFWDNPAWSRDGTRIATIGYTGNPQASLPSASVLAVVEVASGEVTVVSEFSQADGFLHSFPRWSPDDSALVLNVDNFTGEEFSGSTVAIMRETDSDWSEPESITELGEFARPDWHPTEDLIVFCSFDVGGFQSTDEPSNLFTIRPDGSDLAQITNFGPGGERASQPTWTPDGRIMFTYITGPDDGSRDLAFVNADGTGLDALSIAAAVGPGNRPHPRLRPVP